MHKSLLGVLTLIVLGGGGCGSGGPGSFKGTVRGRGLKVADAVFFESTNNSAAAPVVEVILGDRGTLCADVQAGRLYKESSLLDMLFSRTLNGSYVDPDKGNYTIGASAGRSSLVLFLPFDANCKVPFTQSEVLAAGGTARVSDLRVGAGGHIEGTFDLTIGQQAEQVTGTFSAEWCDLTNRPASFSCQ